MIEVFPACSTEKPDLEELYNLQNSLNNRISLRLLLTDLSTGSSTNVIYGMNHQHRAGFFILGAIQNFGHVKLGHGQLNVVFRPSRILLNSWRNWFNFVWAKTVPITPVTVAIPPLVPTQGSPKATKMWKSYVDRCHNDVPVNDSPLSKTVEIDEKTNEIVVKNNEGEIVSPTQELNIPRISVVGEKINRILEQGNIVSIIEASRSLPLDVPIKAEWFDIESLSREGTVIRRITFRISVLNANEQKQLENKRKMVPLLLRRLSYSMGRSMYWIPEKAVKMFEKEMDRVNKEGSSLFKQIVDNDVNSFVESKKKEVYEDANQMFKQFHPKRELPQAAFNEIMNDLKRRLSKVFDGKILPEVSYSPIGLEFSSESKWNAPWKQALVFMKSVFLFPRKIITDPYFLRGLRINQEDLVRSMCIYDDHIVAELLKRKYDYNRATAEISFIDELTSDDGMEEVKCEALFKLMDGVSIKDVDDII